MRNNLYKLAWFLTLIIFLAFYAYKGAVCLMGSCLGDNNVGIVWGIGAVIIYSIFLKLAGKSAYWELNGVRKGFLFYLIILIVVLVYFLGKINS